MYYPISIDDYFHIYSTTEISTWGSASSVGFEVATSVECGVPFVSEGKVQISASIQNLFTYGESMYITREKLQMVNVKVRVRYM